MQWRALAVASLALNLVLAAAWWGTVRPGRAIRLNPAPAPQPREEITNTVVRRQLFSWDEVESPDYPTYVANLRDIGCPEQTVRDIIVADVNALYARRRATEVITPYAQWWRTEPDLTVVRAAADKIRQLEQERTGLLVSLLGTNWETGDQLSLPRPSRAGLVLDGPQLGTLPLEVKERLQEIQSRSDARVAAYVAAQQRAGRSPDGAEIARLRQQTRDELASVLAPGQLEEYLLRYSLYADRLRSEFADLRYFGASSNEFLAVFRATDGINQQIELASGADAANQRQRAVLQQSREEAIKNALGPKRYQEYRQLQDPVYQQAMAQAVAAGTPDAVGAMYQIALAAQAEKAGISADTTLSDQQRAIELQQLQLNQLKANLIASGGTLPDDAPPLPPSAPVRTYTLGPGDTPNVISLIYGIPMGVLRQANPGINFNRLRPGDSVIIPDLSPGGSGSP